MNRKHSLEIFRAALAAADPERATLKHIELDGQVLRVGRRRYPLSRFDRIQLIGAGKASAAMARAVERVLGNRIEGGWINVPDGAEARQGRAALHAAGHPVPDARGENGAREILKIADEAGPRDLLIALISGGASALLPAPVEGLSFAAKQDITRRLLASGATIHEMNTVRKHLSRIKGGQLARRAFPATTVALVLSDVVGDVLDTIGSGPTVPDPTTVADSRAVLARYGLRIRESLLRETPKPGDAVFERVRNVVIGSNRTSIDAAAAKARDLGYRPLVLSTTVQGETRDIASMHSAIAREILATGRPARRPVCILSGGETTVTLRGKGLGGRNQEFVLAAAIELEEQRGCTIFSAGTDGIDGPTDAAGAVADETTVRRARALGLDARRFLVDNDSYHFFERVNGLIKTGPTGTNVMDVRILLIP